ncbi:MAG: sigma-54 dependent transcriptional regulator [Planctomycetota bacterium]|jgi:DNA-binding NtrC family response regulator
MAKVKQVKVSNLLVIGETAEAIDDGPFGIIASKVIRCDGITAAIKQLTDTDIDLAVLGELLATEDAMAFLRRLRVVAADLPVIVLTAKADVKLAVEFVRLGACDYIETPLVSEKLVELIARAMGAAGRQPASPAVPPICPDGVGIVGLSDAMTETLDTLKMIAHSQCNPVLIMGETGTGKELAAQAVHAWRCGHPENFVAVNCAALTASLLESELFGHVKGAFTGADRDKTGLFELAGDGTIFLDEISEMPLDLQPKLLRVLQERTFRPVGGMKDLTCQATIIASSNRNLLEASREGKFRQDLYYRLAVFPVTLPALRHPSRRDDIPMLAEHFLTSSQIAGRQFEGLADCAIELLADHHWPGNVRELRNVIERAAILAKGPHITAESIRIDRHGDHDSPAGRYEPHAKLAPTVERPTKPSDFSLETAEREFILRALKETGWQRTRAAALLGITRATLHAKLKRYAIEAPDASRPAGDAATRKPTLKSA